MIDPLNKNQLAEYRIEKAWEFHNDANLLIQRNSQASAINRLYYALLNMVLALFLITDIHARSHKGIQQKFSEHFIKTGILDIWISKLFRKLQALREEADYGNYLNYPVDIIKELAEQTEQALTAIENYIRQKLTKDDTPANT